MLNLETCKELQKAGCDIETQLVYFVYQVESGQKVEILRREELKNRIVFSHNVVPLYSCEEILTQLSAEEIEKWYPEYGFQPNEDLGNHYTWTNHNTGFTTIIEIESESLTEYWARVWMKVRAGK